MKKLLLIIGLVALLITGCATKTEEIPNEEEIGGQETESEQKKNAALIAPDFKLESLDGTTVKLSELRDKNVIVNFWATWCGYCVMEMPDLQKLQEAHKDDLLVLAINVVESKDVVQSFIEENGLDINVVLDEDMNVASTYGIRSFPTTISINKKGEAIQGYTGMLTYEQMEQLYSFFEE